MPSARLHDGRHTAATLLLERGVPARVVTEILGHSSSRITLDVYSHVTPKLSGEAAAAMGRVVGRPAGMINWSSVMEFLSSGFGPEIVGGVAAGLVAVLTVQLTHWRSAQRADKDEARRAAETLARATIEYWNALRSRGLSYHDQWAARDRWDLEYVVQRPLLDDDELRALLATAEEAAGHLIELRHQADKVPSDAPQHLDPDTGEVWDCQTSRSRLPRLRSR